MHAWPPRTPPGRPPGQWQIDLAAKQDGCCHLQGSPRVSVSVMN
eukprot:COSAG04_NODE_8704_length_941_cov_1.030879_4_plen_43_part_01